MQYHVGKLEDLPFTVPHGYTEHARGYERASLVDRSTGSVHMGGMRSYHDHPIEEFYFALSGETFMDIEGRRFHLRPGDFAWTGVGACHAFAQTGDEPFRWIETQAPQFPDRNGTRNYAEWEKFKNGF